MVQEGAFCGGPYSYRGQHADFRVHPQRNKAFAGATASATVSSGGGNEVGWGGAVIIGALILFGM